jgi:transcriptional regulator with XRE-family HTH domain
MAVKSHPRSLDAIAARLRATRAVFGLAQYEFAERAGISGNTYNQYEQARNLPRLDFANQLCDTYGVTLDWIYRGDISGLPVHIANLLTRGKSSEGSRPANEAE